MDRRLLRLEAHAPKQIPIYEIWHKYRGETEQEALARVAERVPGGDLTGREVFLIVWGASDSEENHEHDG